MVHDVSPCVVHDLRSSVGKHVTAARRETPEPLPTFSSVPAFDPQHGLAWTCADTKEWSANLAIGLAN